MLKMIIRENDRRERQPSRHQRGVRDRRSSRFAGVPVDNAGLVRFHLNVGKNDGLIVSDVLDFMTAEDRRSSAATSRTSRS
ncbi:MAG: hypothetical protein MZU97_23975 [Bacillus subtilis]|nr:hypothetical protein [Bacillus subtilis]